MPITHILQFKSGAIQPTTMTIEGPGFTVDENGSYQFNSRVTYNDASEAYESASWSVTPHPDVSIDSNGLLTVGELGQSDPTTVDITASFTDPIHSITVQETRTITLTDLTVYPSSIEITGATSMNELTATTFTATATYTDASNSNVTTFGNAVWSVVSGPLTVTNEAVGEFTAGNVGVDTPAQIRVEYTSNGATVSDTFDVNVIYVPPVVSSIGVTGPGSVDEGSSGVYTAVVNWSDATQTAPTTGWTWSVDAPATVTPIAGTNTATVSVPENSITVDTNIVVTAEYNSVEGDSPVVTAVNTNLGTGDWSLYDGSYDTGPYTATGVSGAQWMEVADHGNNEFSILYGSGNLNDTPPMGIVRATVDPNNNTISYSTPQDFGGNSFNSYAWASTFIGQQASIGAFGTDNIMACYVSKNAPPNLLMIPYHWNGTSYTAGSAQLVLDKDEWSAKFAGHSSTLGVVATADNTLTRFLRRITMPSNASSFTLSSGTQIGSTGQQGNYPVIRKHGATTGVVMMGSEDSPVTNGTKLRYNISSGVSLSNSQTYLAGGVRNYALGIRDLNNGQTALMYQVGGSMKARLVNSSGSLASSEQNLGTSTAESVNYNAAARAGNYVMFAWPSTQTSSSVKYDIRNNDITSSLKTGFLPGGKSPHLFPLDGNRMIYFTANGTISGRILRM